MKFSLVIPTYNGQKYIEETILSVLNQTRPFDEIIISDDNSIDKTIEICEKYSDRIKIYRNPGGPSGFVNGWNNGISKAKGEYISILHQDDLLSKDFLSSMEVEIDKNRHVYHFFSTCNYIDKDGRILSYSYKEEAVKRYTGLEYVKAYQSSGDPHIHRCPGVITHRSVFDKMQYNPDAGHIADDDFFYRVGKYTDVVGILNPLAFYRLHSESETGALGDLKLVKRLVNDYLFQVNQWKNDNFLDKEAFTFFTSKLKKYSRRQIGYSLSKMEIKSLIKGVKIYLGLY